MNELESLQNGTTSVLSNLIWPTVVISVALFLVVIVYASIRGDGSIIAGFLGWFSTISVLVFVLATAMQEDQDWKAYAAEHCKVIEKRDGQTTTGVGLSMNGKVGSFFGSTDAQTAYKCDDGVTYWKND
jgi:hypothetical protein